MKSDRVLVIMRRHYGWWGCLNVEYPSHSIKKNAWRLVSHKGMDAALKGRSPFVQAEDERVSMDAGA